MQLNKDRLPGARRLRVLEAKERSQQAQQEAKQAFANYQAAQTGPVIPGGQQGIGLPPDESLIASIICLLLGASPTDAGVVRYAVPAKAHGVRQWSDVV